MRPLMRALCCALSLVALAAGGASAQLSERPLRIIMTNAPGGSLDLVVRLYADRLKDLLKVPIVIEGKPGAGALVATQYVLQQPADGYTLLAASANLSTIPALYPQANIEPARDLAGVAQIVSLPMFVTVNNDLPARSFNELVDYVRARPGTVNLGMAGLGSFDHLVAEALMSRLGLRFNTVPYKGEQPAMLDLVGGRTQVQIATWITLAPQVKAQRVRPLAATTGQRAVFLPDLPSLAEQQGLTGFAAGAWFGLFARSTVPRETVVRLNRAVIDVQQNRDLREQLANVGGQVPSGMNAEQFQEMFREEVARWGTITRQLNIKAQ